MCVQADLQRFDLLHRLFKEPCRHFTQRNYSADNKALDESLYFALLSLGATGLCWTHRVSGYWIKKFPSIKGVSTNIRLLFVKTNKVFHLMILHPPKKLQVSIQCWLLERWPLQCLRTVNICVIHTLSLSFYHVFMI